MTAPLEPLPLLRFLHERGVRFIVIGGIAGVLQGSPLLTQDLDICYARDLDNLDALSIALREIGAYLRGAPPGLPFVADGEVLRNGMNFTFTTTMGDLDCLAEPAGADFGSLMPNALSMDIGGVEVLVSCVEDLIRMKEAAGRTKDMAAVPYLKELLREIELQERAKKDG